MFDNAETAVSRSDGIITNLGAALVAETTYDARDLSTTAFFKMKGFKGDEKCGWIGDTSFVLRFRGVSVKQLISLDWAEDRYDQSISESDIQQVIAKENLE